MLEESISVIKYIVWFDHVIDHVFDVASSCGVGSS